MAPGSVRTAPEPPVRRTLPALKMLTKNNTKRQVCGGGEMHSQPRPEYDLVRLQLANLLTRLKVCRVRCA